jgi:hypothetical protein
MKVKKELSSDCNFELVLQVLAITFFLIMNIWLLPTCFDLALGGMRGMRYGDPNS